MSERARSFVDSLSSISLKDVFNPYSDLCALHDRLDAVAVRQRNLERSLSAAIDLDVRTIWIARDLGYRGGRRTGLALTDEFHLDSYSSLFDGLAVEKATKGPAIGERTANVIWKMLIRVNEPVFLWNVFPLHPHEPEQQMSNRCHTASERRACLESFAEVIAMLRPERVIAIGGDAHKSIKGFGFESVLVRHPSYGGQNTFIQQIEDAYNLKSQELPDLFGFT